MVLINVWSYGYLILHWVYCIFSIVIHDAPAASLFFAFPVLQWPGVLVEVFLKLMFFNLVLTDLIGVIHCVVVPEFLYQCQF